ncbi:cytochrome P450 [Mycena sp. CBHHK59/15]|nr:cytochrome P450 [Mycena sp. CBHHK59/15]
MIVQLICSIFGALLSYTFFRLVQFLYGQLASPLRGMVGPQNSSLLFGHFKEMESDATITDRWQAEFGLNFQIKSLLSARELYTADTKALNHIVLNSYTYQKPPFARYQLSRVVGKGLLVVEEDVHKHQRKILNPAFGVPQIRALTEVFVEKSIQLRDIWVRQIAAGGNTARIEVLSWMSKMTLDVIGQAGFNYQFDALEPKGKPSELNTVFHQIFHSPPSQLKTGLRLVQAIVPILRPLPIPGGKLLIEAQEKMTRIGKQLLAESKGSLATEGAQSRRRDLLSLLLRANMDKGTPDHQRMSDSEMVDQLPTFFVAGHETTSTATAWALHALSLNLPAQRKLREELFTLATDTPTLDELNSLPYLENVIRECMRVHSPVAFTGRMAMADDVLPLSKPYVDSKGGMHDSLRIAKGQLIHIPILAVNCDKDTWGEDAAEFRPERWDDLPDSVKAVPGVWAHLFTFLGGPRNCIGFRFALAEMKALLFILIRAFEFEPTVPVGGIGRSSTPVQRPIVLSERDKGSQMPLIVRLYSEA